MPRQRSPARDKAKELYLKSSGEISLTSITEELGLPEGTIRGWKAKDGWDAELNGTLQTNDMERSDKNTERSERDETKPSIKSASKAKQKTLISKTNTNSPKAGQSRPGNRNAIGNRGGKGGPKGNKHAVGNPGGSGAPLRNKFAFKTGEFESILKVGIVDKTELDIGNV